MAKLYKKRKEKRYFYNHFISIESLKRVGNPDVYLKESWHSISIIFLSLIPPVVFTIAGYDFRSVGWAISLLPDLVIIFIIIKNYIKFEKFVFNFNIFKNKLVALFLPLSPIVLSAIFSILPIWTTKIIYSPDGTYLGFSINVALIVQFYFPIYFILGLFSVYSYILILAKFAINKTVLAYR